ncbi:MAG TPA: OsmC family protein [Solirubrobacteraceae bacterium]|jgi:putative redox protein|nr:OsmC family protein [Solirubrobacteraceae bacterium]
MKATAHRADHASYTHSVDIRNHQIVIDEPEHVGGTDEGPSPQELLAASLASCTAITMEMYAKRKGWEIGPLGVSVEYSPSERGCPTKFTLNLRLPSNTTTEQRERLQVIAAKCPIHRILEGEVMFEDRVTIADGPVAETAQRAKREPLLRRRTLSRN